MAKQQELFGHERAIQLLRSSWAEGKFSHATILAGPDRIGKKTMLLHFIQELFCPEQGCGQCAVCAQVQDTSHPDVLFLTVPEDKTSIPIDGVRALQNALHLKPYSAPVKFAIIDNAHLLKKEASNALLKTLEEPPAGSCIVLITSQLHLLPTTIRSRCRIIRCSPVSASIIETLCKKSSLSSEDQNMLTTYAQGRIGWVKSLLDSPEAREDFRVVLDYCSTLPTKPMHERLSLFEAIAKDRERMGWETLLSVLLLWVQHNIHLAVQERTQVHMSSLWTDYYNEVLHVAGDFVYNSNRRLMMERLFVTMPKQI